jgi:hypothetical protein
MTSKNGDFSRYFFRLLMNEFSVKYSIELNTFGEYERARVIINGETKEEEFNRLNSEVKLNKRYRDDGKLSEETIKCMLGISSYSKTHDTSTLSIIARKLNYIGWEDFIIKAVKKYNFKNGCKLIDMYDFGGLNLNEDLCIGWYPDKYCVLRYLGDYEFEVIENYEMRSEIGRKFYTVGFELECADYKHIRDVDDIYPGIIIQPFLDDDPDWQNIKERTNYENYLL